MKPSDIGRIVHRDSSTVRNILHKYNVFQDTINHVTETEWNNIVSDYNNGMTPKELSIKYNRSDGFLINKLKSAGIFRGATLRLTKDQWNDIINLYQEGENDIIFNKYPSLSISTLYSKMSELKIQSGKKNFWSDDDKEIIRNNYYDCTIDELYNMIDGRHTKDSIESLALKSFGYSRSRLWTEQEDEILKKNYSNMLVNELQELLPNRSIEAIRIRGKKYKLTAKYCIDVYWSNEETDYLLNNWQKMSDVEIGEKLCKTPSSVKDRRNLLGLFRVQKNKQGYTTIKNMLRGQIWNWKQESIKACNYCCVLTGSKEFHIHHLYGFSDIFNKYLEIHPLKSQNVSDYTEQEIDEICDSFIKLHDQYPLGVCVRPDLHDKFHQIFGKHNNTPEQWDKFVKMYNNQ